MLLKNCKNSNFEKVDVLIYFLKNYIYVNLLSLLIKVIFNKKIRS